MRGFLDVEFFSNELHLIWSVMRGILPQQHLENHSLLLPNLIFVIIIHFCWILWIQGLRIFFGINYIFVFIFLGTRQGNVTHCILMLFVFHLCFACLVSLKIIFIIKFSCSNVYIRSVLFPLYSSSRFCPIYCFWFEEI